MSPTVELAGGLAPAIHRDIHGERNDHALVECNWKWRIRTKTQPCKDLNCLFAQETDEHGIPAVNTHMMVDFEAAMDAKPIELKYSASNDNTTTDMYAKKCTIINHAIDSTVPTRTKKQGARREVSETTQKLFKEREQLRGRGTSIMLTFRPGSNKTVLVTLNFKKWMGNGPTPLNPPQEKETRERYMTPLRYLHANAKSLRPT